MATTSSGEEKHQGSKKAGGAHCRQLVKILKGSSAKVYGAQP